MRRFLSKWWWAVYLPLLLVSHLVQGSFGTASAPVDPRQTGRKTVELDVPMRGGGVAPIELAYLEWGSNTGDPAVVLLHGSPGNASTFTGMGQLMFHASSLHPGYRVLAPDLPGFGHSTGYIPDYSISFHADSVIAWLDALGVERAHLVGFSLGGGVILHVSERRPDLVASLTLLAAVGAEETEGSGAHWFEQLKYGVGYGALVIAPEMIPHFGVLGERQRRHAFLRNFFDTDQRPLRAIMEANEHPALILHGRHDPLIAPWAAERHHELMDNSRLVMLDDDHFFPFLRPMLAFDAMSRFLNRHSTPGAAIRTDAVYEVEPGAHPLGAWGERLDWRVRLAPAWLTLWLMVVASVFAPRAALVVGALLVPAAYLDVGVVLLGALVGRTVRCRGRRWLRMLARTLGSLVLVAFLVGPLALAGVRAAEPPVSTLLTLLAPIVAYALLVLLPRVCTWRGRARLSASVRRRLHHEFWPAWVLYLPLLPYLLWLAVRHRGLLAFTAANPGVPAGGGLVGESKRAILSGLQASGPGRAAVLAFESIGAEGAAERRAGAAARAVGARPELGGWPVVIKPDMGWRGASVRVCHDESDAERFFASIDRPAIVQRFHAGPGEVGVLWIRDPASVRDEGRRPAGSIYAITLKHFPSVVGDGRRTLERLVLDDRRLRMQERAFAERHDERWREVLPEGERLRLVNAGNHYQGSRFTDGAHLITPELERAIDEIASGYRGPNGAPLDFGRFDIRYADEDGLRAGRGLGIVELNGSTSEATNIYDPGRSTWWAYGVLFGQWRRLFELGAARRRAGGRAMRAHELVAMLWGYWRRPRAPADSD